MTSFSSAREIEGLSSSWHLKPSTNYLAALVQYGNEAAASLRRTEGASSCTAFHLASDKTFRAVVPENLLVDRVHEDAVFHLRRRDRTVSTAGALGLLMRDVFAFQLVQRYGARADFQPISIAIGDVLARLEKFHFSDREPTVIGRSEPEKPHFQVRFRLFRFH